MLVTERNIAQALCAIERHDELTIDLETTGLNLWREDKLCGIAIQAGEQSYYLPFRHGAGENLPIERILDVRSAICRPGVTWRMHNALFDLAGLYRDGFAMPWQFGGQLSESMTAVHLLNENERSLKLKDLGDKYIAKGSSQYEDELLARIKSANSKWGKGDMWRLPAEQVEEYARQDVKLTSALIDFCVPLLYAGSLYDLWQEYNEYQMLLAKMHIWGVKLDVERIELLRAEATSRASDLLARIREMAGYDINLNSPKQVQAWLGVKSSAKDVLEDMPNVPGVSELQSYRAWSKAVNTYYDVMLSLMDENQVLHPNLSITGTVSGRLSCSRPNLQAIPQYREEYKVKEGIIARPGYVLLTSDLSQAEMRVASHYAQEEAMMAVLRAGADIHSSTAERLGIPRQSAKRINFGIVYRIGAAALARDLDIPVKEAAAMLDAYNEAYPGFQRLYETAELRAKTRGFIRLFTGRRRHFNHNKRAPTHKAMSNLVQGTVAEMMRLAMLRIDRGLSGSGAHLVLQVHDDVLLEVPEGLEQEAAKVVINALTDWPWLSVPMVAEAKIGHRLNEVKPYQ